MKFSPTVKVYVNLAEMVHKIDAVAERLNQPEAFYLGKLQDGLALDPLTGYSRLLIPFFAEHPLARMTVLTKSASVGNVLAERHNGHTALAWSLAPEAIGRIFEPNTPSLQDRLAAMEQCAAAGYPIRAMIMPVIPVDGWEDAYRGFLHELIHRVRLQRITLGGVCSYRSARALMNQKMGRDNAVENHLDNAFSSPDGRARYGRALRLRLYRHLIECIRQADPHLPISLCMEDMDVVREAGLEANLGKCVCLW